MEHLWGMAAPVGARPPVGGTGSPAQEFPKERLRGTAAPIGAGQPAETGSRAQEAVAAYGVHAGDGSPHWRGPTSWGDGESSLGGGCCLWSTCGGQQPPSARAHQLG